MGDTKQKAAAKAFTDKWLAKEGYEKGETQQFWTDLLHDVYGIERVTEYIEFEKRIKLDNNAHGFIDGYIPSVPVLIEQKGRHVDIRKKERQSDGAELDPHGQAKRYMAWMKLSEKPKYIIVCNFYEFLIYDEEHPTDEPVSIMLSELPKEFHRMNFLVKDTGSIAPHEDPISKQAGDLVGELKKALSKEYKDPTTDRAQRSICILCVRLVFCLYAEDSGVFKGHLQFHDYLEKYAIISPAAVRTQLIELFKVLDTPKSQRDYIDDELDAFPYVNGGLFADEDIEIPRFTPEIIDILLNKASAGFDWSQINPTIFGAMFESVLNSDDRSKGGMHYTEPKNIHKVIDPLFLDELKGEFDRIKGYKDRAHGAKVRELENLRKKMSELVFLDPACGSGNFLTETYISLRRLENSIISEIRSITENEQMAIAGTVDYTDIKVKISQFYGIEIHDFAVSVAKTALWIAEHQMLRETEEILHQSLDFLPLKSYANIVHGNALRINWEDVVSKDKLSYIMGNPPFEGHQKRTDDQVKDMSIAFYDLEKHGKLDYVCAWYNKATDYMKSTDIQAAFVSTNSIVQGESVGILWKFLIEKKNLEIQFAHQSFIWDSEATDMARVHCVIIGFTTRKSNTQKKLYQGENVRYVEHINGYLADAKDLYIQSRGMPLRGSLPKMSKGSQPTDGGFLILTSSERDDIVSKYPNAEKLIKRYIGSDDFINNRYRYCLWLDGVSPSTYRQIPPIIERLKGVSESRSKSPTKSVKEAATTPSVFTQIRQPTTKYLAVPEVSSEQREYIPIGFLTPDVIASNKLYLVPNADIFMFGILISNVHMSWMRIVAGRLEMRYSYSPAVYNNFPWCNPSPEQKTKIEQTAQGILDARALYPDSSLADLYDELTMPPELRKAHKANDKAVMQAYGFKADMSESEIVAELMKMYKAMTE